MQKICWVHVKDVKFQQLLWISQVWFLKLIIKIMPARYSVERTAENPRDCKLVFFKVGLMCGEGGGVWEGERGGSQM